MFWLVVILILEGLFLMAAIDDLNTNVTQLKTDVEAYIASQAGAVPAAQVEAAAANVAAIDAEVKAAQSNG